MPPDFTHSPGFHWEPQRHICPSEVNWNGRFNQRQNRKNKRRAHAAGKRNAFR